MNDLVVIPEQKALTAADMRAHVNLIQEVMQAVMIGPSKENPTGVHYGKIPGTPKNTLYKPGAEVLCVTFRIAPTFEVEELFNPNSVRYRVKCIGVHQPTGTVLGQGLGECSTDEEKYKWRSAVCKEEYDDTPEDRRRIKYKAKKNEGHYTIKQIRTEPADLANTVLKMACKRAQVAMSLNTTGASDIFSQDIEDMPDELRESIIGTEQREPVKAPPPPARKANAKANKEPPAEGQDEPKLAPGQVKILRMKMTQAEVADDVFAEKFGGGPESLPASMINEALDFCSAYKAEKQK